MTQHTVQRGWSWVSDLRWWLRGVGVADYRQPCRRCGRPGQMHWTWRGCWRFAPARKGDR